ncbi:flagellar assembly protein FliX [Pseudovibrio exalbescens]|uniref:flagellar assembly protein FliX n=1 Tax=Pseudovibrio exalbescens TaxID=197461 RepID=UPI0023653F4A|nr:flagellar assembly protein FliX [Pseudovibrio exalbescens]MDD7910434.1 flagellar assembly protein FliX [Pseudovibrio exalbescens]
MTVLIRTTPVSGLSATAGVKKTKNDPKKSSNSFSVEKGGSEAQSAQSSAHSSGIHNVDALLMLQQVDDPMTGKRKAMKHGLDLLDELDLLKIDLLQGRVSPERLEKIVSQLSNRVKSGDAGLDQIVEDIELRARIELAKLGRFPE